MSIKIEPQTRLSIGADAINTGLLVHERGGLEIDASSFNGMLKIAGGTTSFRTTAEVWSDITGDALGATSITAYRGDRGTTAYNHSQAAHLALGATSSTAYRGDRGTDAYNHISATGASHSYIDQSVVVGTGVEFGKVLCDAAANTAWVLLELKNDNGTRLTVSGAGAFNFQAGSMVTTGTLGAGNCTFGTVGCGAITSSGILTLSSATSRIQGGTRLAILAGTDGVSSTTIFQDETVSAANLNIVGSSPYQIKHSTSSIRFKDKVKDLEVDSSLIYNLRPVSFDSKCKGDDKDRRFIGLIAEEVEQICPEMINYGDNKIAVSYDSQMLATLMLTEIQNLNQRIIKLERPGQ